ncbi:MAG: hypothetical protein IMZ51_04060 [Chloroflexi bacterium]|nr:hypothetical protein [Chloroflexota bacterium]
MSITNKDIYNKIVELEKLNNESHNLMIEHQVITNGKVKLNKWIATTALTMIMGLVGYVLVNLVMGG